MAKTKNDAVALPAASFILPDLIARLAAALEGPLAGLQERIDTAIQEAIWFALGFGSGGAPAFATGIWDDFGVWDDDAAWSDGPIVP